MPSVSVIIENPTRLLLIDAFGALITFIVTAFLFVPEWIPTGMPVNVLYVMACVAAGFFLTGLSAFVFVSDHKNPIRLMAALNLTYCLTASIFCIIFSSALTKWGLIYFPIEIVVVAILGFWELQISGRPTTQ